MIIMDPANIEASLDAWANGQRSEVFNEAAQTDKPRRIDMSPANDSKPGILGLTR